MVVQPAVGDEEHLAARHLAVDDAVHVDAGLADEVAAELDDERAPPAAAAAHARSHERRRRLAPIGCEVERLSRPGSTGMPKPPPMLRTRTGAARCVGEPQRELDRLALRLADRSRRAGSASRRRCGSPRTVEAGRARARASSAGTRSASMPNCLRPAAHLHARGLELEVGVDAHRDARRQRRALARCATSAADLASRDSTLTSMPAATACVELGRRSCPGPAKLMSRGRGAGVERDPQLARRGDVEPSTSRAMCCTSAGIGLAFIA